jgi:phenylacetate-CoA ligase
MMSTSMALGPALRRRLEERFGCPVLDVYSLNEAGPVGVLDSGAGGHVLLQPGLYVETLDADGRPAVRGEVTLTGGFNFCLPLLRYRTGDHGELGVVGDEPVLLRLQGRPPVRFRTTRGEWINNIDVTHALGRFPLVQYSVHQGANGGLTVRAQGRFEESALRDALFELFGASQDVAVERAEAFDDKVVQYTSDLPESSP